MIQQGKIKKSILILLLVLISSGIFFVFNKTKAQQTVTAPSTDALLQVNTQLTVKDRIKKAMEKVKEYVKKKGAGSMIKSATRNFVQTLAYETASKIAQGGPGKQVLGWDIPWDTYLKDATGAAIGDFLGNLSDVFGVNLCDPGKLGKLDLALGIIEKLARRPKPKCDWQEIKTSWQNMDEGEFLKKLSWSFNPNVNYLGSEYLVYTDLQSQIQERRTLAQMTRGIRSETMKGITDTVSGWTRTPGTVVADMAKEPFQWMQTQWGSNMVGDYIMGDIVTPAFDTFFTTLSGKLMQKWLTKGLFDSNAYDASKNFGWMNNADTRGTNVISNQSVKAAYADFMRPQFEPGGNEDILSELSSCPYPTNPGPINCVIESNFRAAISQKITVGEALNNGNLLKDGIFGFVNSGKEPNYNGEGYPLRSIRILRRYRIVPVGWEIAAEYIEKFASTKPYTLQQMVDCYSPTDEWNETNTKEEWCRGLVDPNWLLKAPAYMCEKEGYGQEIVSEQVTSGKDVNNDGDYNDVSADGSTGSDIMPNRSVSRNKFCVSDKSCIKESPDGKCLKWGNCLEEKRIWRFNGESCDAQFNTCQSFVGKNGKEISYVRSTLDYSGCDATNAGCSWYCQDYDSANKKWTCSVKKAAEGDFVISGSRVFFNKFAGQCDAKAEGCHEFIKMQAGLNLIYNGELEFGADDEYTAGKFNFWPVKNGNGTLKITKTIDAEKGGYTYVFETQSLGDGLYSYDGVDSAKFEESMMPEGYGFDISKTYILSADVKIAEGEIEMGIGSDILSQWEIATSTETGGKWKRMAVVLPAGDFLAREIFIGSHKLGGNGKTIFSLDNVKLEEALPNQIYVPGFKSYNSKDNLTYLKKAPEYLGCQVPGPGVTNPDECKNFAASCRKEQEGCSKFTPVNGDPWIPGIVSADDKCDLACVNYKSYKQSATNFSREVMNVNFIAENPYRDDLGGAICQAQEIGCSEFTNLDKLEQGGEAREYYSYLRRCNKPSAPGISCGTFYTWIGNDTAGYELKTYYLKKDQNGSPVELANPKFPNCPEGEGDQGDPNCCRNAADAKVNPNCKEFYNESGAIFYAIYPTTVTCSEDCHPYKKTSEKISQSACLVYESKWVENKDISEINDLSTLNESNNDDGICQLEVENCLYSGGEWKNRECIYDALPGEGVSCPSQAVGCNEYVGTSGSNVKNVLPADTFENRTNSGWQNGISSNEATIVGGQSLTVDEGTTSIEKNVNSSGGKLNAYKTYAVSFLALNKGADKPLNIIFKAGKFFSQHSVIISSGEWREYKVGNIYLSGDLDENNVIDQADLDLIQKAKDNPMSVTSRQRDLADISGDGKITDEDKAILAGEIENLKNLTAQFIEIGGMDKNIFLDNILIKEIQENIYRIKDTWTVPQECDTPSVGAQLGCAEYRDMQNRVVQLKSLKLCPTEAIGCTRMIDTQNSFSLFKEIYNEGEEGQNIVPRDKVIYIVNDSSKECLKNGEEKGCERLGVPQFTQDKTSLVTGSEYRQGDIYLLNNPDQYGKILCNKGGLFCDEFTYTDSAGMDYFKDPGDKVCEFDKNAGKWVKKGTKDNCPVGVDINKVLGSVPGSQIKLPTNGWAGFCDSTQSGCTEYIDPLSNNEPNLVYNGNFEQDAQALDGGDADGPDGWSNFLACASDKYSAEDFYCPECCSGGYSGTKGAKKGEKSIALTAKGLYTFSAEVRGTGEIKITGCSVSSPDGSMDIKDNGNSASKSFENISHPDNALEMDLVSGRFYVSEAPAGGCNLVIDASAGMVDEVSIQQTDIYYNIATNLDAGECAGKVNLTTGCALLNERKFTQQGMTNNDKVLKVQPDRTCGRWLSETSSYITEDGESNSLNLSECIGDSSSNACAVRVNDEKKNRNFNEGSVSLLQNISGLSKVGFEWSGGQKIEGYYPLSRMPQIGQYIKMKGGFEEVEKRENHVVPGSKTKDIEIKPVNWGVADPENTDKIIPWSGNCFKVIDNPVTAQKEGLEPKAPVGKNFLRLTESCIARLEDKLPVYGNTSYVISGYVDSRNILTSSAKSGIYVKFYDGMNNEIGDEVGLDINEGKKWMFLSKEIVTPAQAKTILIILKNSAAAPIKGNSYFDEIAVYPALEVQKGLARPSLCKVYPQEDSLSCEYEDENEIFYKGNRGYCLEYDRAPGDPSNCISWFPVDVIRGEEGREIPPLSFAGFGKGPLYYCLEAQFMETRKLTYLPKSSDFSSLFSIFSFPKKQNSDYCGDYQLVKKTKTHCHVTGCDTRIYYWCYPPQSTVLEGSAPPYSFNKNDPDNTPPEAWYYYNNYYNPTYDNNLTTLKTENLAPVYWENFQIRCSKIVQVATIDGDSKSWATRLSSGSNYTEPELSETIDINKTGNAVTSGYNYSSYESPYGALTVGKDGSGVNTWDGEPAINGLQPLSIKIQWKSSPIDPAQKEYVWENFGMGLPYSCSNPDFGSCISPRGTQYYKTSTGDIQGMYRRINVGVKNDLGKAQQKLKNLFVKSYGSWQWQNAGPGKNAGYVPMENLDYKYYKPTSITEFACPPEILLPNPTPIVTWINNGEGVAPCYVSWNWNGGTNTYDEDPNKVDIFEEDDSGNMTINVRDLRCVAPQTLATNPSNILNEDIRPKEQIFVTKKIEDNACYEVTTKYSGKLESITQTKLAAAEEEKTQVLESSLTSQTISKVIKIGSDYYQFIIELSVDTSETKISSSGCPELEKTVKENDKCYKYVYKTDTLPSEWDPPVELCPGKVRDPEKDEYCGIKPSIKNIKVESNFNTDVKIGVANDILLQFNTDVNPDQQPLTEYNIDWGDGEGSIASGLRFLPQPVTPHYFSHTYSYYDLRNKFLNDSSIDKTVLKCFPGNNNSECHVVEPGIACCIVKPRIRIRDNWEWCSDGINGTPCPVNKDGWARYGGWIVLTEK